MKNIVILSGAGTSTESGVNTFRDQNGLWEGHDVMSVASPEGWQCDPALVLNFYNERRKQVLAVLPNKAHILIAELEEYFNVHVITQNVDNLHEKAGSSNVLHLHGELLKSRSCVNEELVYSCTGDILLGDTCELGAQLRPHIVWFGEDVPLLSTAAELVNSADIVIIIGTSMQVYPAASLIEYAGENTEIFYIDPNPAMNGSLKSKKQLEVLELSATEGMTVLWSRFVK